MGYYSDFDRIVRQGLDEDSRMLVAHELAALVDRYVWDTAPVTWHFHGRDGQEADISPEAITAALLAPVSLASVIDDVCRALKVTVPSTVAAALGEEVPDSQHAA